jgi:hypothetical protein
MKRLREFEVFTAMTMQETVFWDLAEDPRRWFPAD